MSPGTRASGGRRTCRSRRPNRCARGTVISGLLSAILGIAGFGADLCLHFPQYLTHADLRPLYSLEYLRAIIHLTLVASFLLGLSGRRDVPPRWVTQLLYPFRRRPGSSGVVARDSASGAQTPDGFDNFSSR